MGLVHKNLLIAVLLVSIVSLSYFVFGDLVREIPMTLTVANQPPRVSNIELNDNVSGDDQLILTAGNTTIIWCAADVWELDGFSDIDNVNGTIWNTGNANYGDTADNRWVYINTSCNITEITGDPVRNARVNCTFPVWFYANYSEWNCTLIVNDTSAYTDNATDNATMNRLIAVDSPNATIDWGARSVDVTYDADLNVSVYNEGNVILDLQIDAYNDTGVGVVSNYSFDCQIGQVRTDAIVFNDTTGSAYGQSTYLDNDTYINYTSFNLYPQNGSYNFPSNKSLYFGIFIPQYPTINGTCNGWMRFEGMDGSP